MKLWNYVVVFQHWEWRPHFDFNPFHRNTTVARWCFGTKFVGIGRHCVTSDVCLLSLDGHRFSIIYFIGWVPMRSAQPILSGRKFLSLKFLAREKCCASNGNLSFLSCHHRISCATVLQLTWDCRICCATLAQLTWDHRLLTILLSDNSFIDDL